MVHRYFAIHGDNIVECERTLKLIERGLADRCISVQGPYGSPTNPSFRLIMDGGDNTLEFVYFPGFGRWDVDIRQLLQGMGWGIREVPDAIISEVRSGREHPLLAIEYSGALAAGNQAWQRSGRAFSSGLARIPYLYVAELGGYELNQARFRKASRLANPAVPFSYLSFSSWMDTPVLPVYVLNPGADKAARATFAPIVGDNELIELVRLTVLGEDVSKSVTSLRAKAMELVRHSASISSKGRTLTLTQWVKAHEAIEEDGQQGLVTYLLKGARLRWSKTTSIPNLTGTAKMLMGMASRLGFGLTSSSLPMCLIGPERREVFAQEVAKIYPGISEDFLDWLRNEKPLAVCWVNGFKPKGDDARPDRGLPPFARMLIGPNVDMLTVVYGPAKVSHWELLVKNPGGLAEQNGLWESVMVTSNALLVDSSTDNVTSHGFLQAHWAGAPARAGSVDRSVRPVPQQIGENDVDTVIHTLLACLGSHQFYEGLCNPPGGDWSGISILTEVRDQELRWLSLPRVSGENSKRPDHVFQVFDLGHKSVILSVESKDRPSSLEERIGPRLKKYMVDLLELPASAERGTGGAESWRQSGVMARLDEGRFASAAAFRMSSGDDLPMIGMKSDTDLLFGLQFNANNTNCEVQLFPGTEVGSRIARLIGRLVLGESGISVRIRQ